MDFTVKKYKQLLTEIKKLNIQVYGILKWYEKKPTNGILIRHDVDRRPKQSLEIAKLEASMNIFTTYYFRITSNSFEPEIIKQISELGHEVGYHYEDLSLANGDYDKAIKLFQKHLNQFEDLAEVKTISMHGRPFSPYDNRDLWKRFNIKDYGIEAEAFITLDYSNFYYFTDTGRSWNPHSINLRDHVNSLKIKGEVNTTDDLIRYINKNHEKNIALVTHPERWSDNLMKYVYIYLDDSLKNLIKKILKIKYKLRK